MSINGKKHHENDDQFQNDQEHTTDNQSTEENNANTEAVTDGTAQQTQAAGEAEQLADALAEQKDKYIRLMAEFENYKRRTAKERIELIQTAGKDIIVSLLDVLDDCDRAEKQMGQDTDINHVKEGSLLVFNKFRKTLEAKGVKSMDSQGKEFDVETQEAIAEVPGTPEQSGKVIDVIQKGYLLNDKLIRFAKVVVGK
ncbi:nucleotide exchange factor GrpE [Arachidicoccus terrestris]|uniref:nucleotide exchange factor GrpE n=1 Tax=Arachidicoccus terrestris TaxID=2875539 RepID=UPI001CC5BA07|nr:nucleotide exchange factor GrpE [Arachidicoccus terrestris]UAY56492.1 nucleotide exchange factor GrpE [Arachidicoccus terrestris]